MKIPLSVNRSFALMCVQCRDSCYRERQREGKRHRETHRENFSARFLTALVKSAYSVTRTAIIDAIYAC